MLPGRQFRFCSKDINQHLFCSICSEVFYNPMRASCGHTFCGQCFTQWIKQKMNCPSCRRKLTRNYQFDTDFLAKNIVGDLIVECLRCEKWTGQLSAFKQHKKSSCAYVHEFTQGPVDAIQITSEEEEEEELMELEQQEQQFPSPPPVIKKAKKFKIKIVQSIQQNDEIPQIQETNILDQMDTVNRQSNPEPDKMKNEEFHLSAFNMFVQEVKEELKQKLIDYEITQFE